MSEIDEKKLEAAFSQARSIFSEELKGHLVFLEKTSSELRELSPEEAAVRIQSCSKQLEHRFHTIKGAAAFLGLKLIQEVAGLAEKLLKESVLDEHSAPWIISALQKHIEKLHDLSS